MRSFKLFTVCAAVLAACSHSQPAPEASPASEQKAAVQPAPPRAQPPPAPAEPAPKPPEPRQTTTSIYFEYDSSTLSEDARASLTRLAPAASQDGATVRIEGNCDERGSVEYNLALGQRRADAAKSYLVRSGVPAARITAISYGEERPKAQGHDEDAWRENRRDDIFVSGLPAVSGR